MALLDTSESFVFRAARAYFYRIVLKCPSLGWLSDWKLHDIEGNLTWHQVLSRTDDPKGTMFVTKNGKTLLMTKVRGIQMLCEFDADSRWYVEGVNLKGATVLDVGGGCGEMDERYFEAGAMKVVAIDSDAECSRLHKINADKFGWNVEVINEAFTLEHLSIFHTFGKYDMEGSEELFLDPSVNDLGKVRMELHPQKIGEQKCRAIVNKFGLRKIGSKGRRLVKDEERIRNGDMWGN